MSLTPAMRRFYRANGAVALVPWPAELPAPPTAGKFCQRPASVAEVAVAKVAVDRFRRRHNLLLGAIWVMTAKNGGRYEQRLAVRLVGRRIADIASDRNPPSVWLTPEHLT